MTIGAQSFRHALKASGTISMKPSCGTSRKLLTTYAGKLTETILMNFWSQKKKESAPGPDGILFDFYKCAGRWGSQYLNKACKHVIEGGPVQAQFAESGTMAVL